MIDAIAQHWPSPGVARDDPSVSPIEGAEALANSGIRIQIYTGTRDITYPSHERFKKRLVPLGLNFELFAVSPLRPPAL